MKPKKANKGSIIKLSPYDLCQTPASAVQALIPYIHINSIIWEPANGEGYLSAALRNRGFHVFSSDIQDSPVSHNFFDCEPFEWTVQITNPPYSIKPEWIERSISFGKPFALLLPLETIGAWENQRLLKEIDLKIIFLKQRVNFKMPGHTWEESRAQFPVAWFCADFDLIPRQINYFDNSITQMSIQPGIHAARRLTKFVAPGQMALPLEILS